MAYEISPLAQFMTSEIRAAVKWDRAHNPGTRLLPRLGRHDLGRRLRDLEFSREMEAAAPPGLALQPDAPADHSYQMRRDREPQSRSAEAARGGAVRL